MSNRIYRLLVAWVVLLLWIAFGPVAHATTVTNTFGTPGVGGAAITNNWVVPAGVTSVQVEMWGGGGGGGGAYAVTTVPVTPGTTNTIIVGGGGLGSTANNTDGGAGGNSSFPGATTAAGGAGGGGNTIGFGGVGGAVAGTGNHGGGPGGTGNGTSSGSGSGGGSGSATANGNATGGATNTTTVTSVAGSAGPGGGAGAAGQTNSTAGIAGNYPGGGGSGGFAILTMGAKSGGNGGGNGGGKVILTYAVLATDIWAGSVNTNWDLTTANWTNSDSGNTYGNGDLVQFDDTASNFTVNVVAPVSPARVLFANHAHNYVVGGAAIAGAGSLTKSGAATVTLTASNTYTGGTLISAGTLALGGTGSISNSTSLTMAAGTSFDVSAQAAFSLSANQTSLTATGTAGSPATIIGGTTVNLGTNLITLNFDGVNPVLNLSQGTLTLGGNTFNVVVPGAALGTNVYTLLTAPGLISGTVNPTPSFAGGNGVANWSFSSVVSISGNQVILTVSDTGYLAQTNVFYQDNFDNDGLGVNNGGTGGGAVNRTIEADSWVDNGDATYVTGGTTTTRRALLYSANAFQSAQGFKLTVYCKTGNLGASGSHNFSFGLISTDTDLATYTGFNPFRQQTNVYSLGANLTTAGVATAQGLNFTDGSTRTTLDQSGSNVQFVAGSSSWVVIDIGPGGAWQYQINGVTEASGIIAGGFDLTKSYRVVVYGQDDDGSGTSIQSLKLETYAPHPGLGERADWMRGAWGAEWKYDNGYNGLIEGVTIDDFLFQISGLRTIDFIQIHLADSNIYSPVHSAPNPIIESLWHGDTDSKGNPINLVVPRASKPDPFLSWLTALNAAGLKAEVYVNSYNLLARDESNIPAAYPDVSARWMKWCDTNTAAQAFINSQPYYTDGIHTNRPYMFCYAEFILKAYAMRYTNLISAWCFDSADNIMEGCGDNAGSGVLDDQRIYEAFANACHAGNPNAAVAFNNSVGVDGAPFATPTLFEDYSFGHPFGGAGDMTVPLSLSNRNFAVCQFMHDTGGLPFTSDSRVWNDKVVGHFNPKMSTTSWNSGAVPCLTDADFVTWTSVGIINGGGITWGTPLVRPNLANSPILTAQPYATNQFALLDAYLMVNQYPGAPNWARAETYLPDANVGQPYYRELVAGVDFWDPETNSITGVTFASAADGLPAWLTLTPVPANPANWMLTGTPTEAVATNYNFRLRVSDASGSRDRWVQLKVNKSAAAFLGLVAEWPLDDGAGAVARDTAANGYDGEATNCIWRSGLWGAGVNGGALAFNGSNSTVVLPAEAFAAISNQISIALWVYGDSTQPRNDSVFYAVDASTNRVLNLHLPYGNGNVYWDGGNSGSSFDRLSKADTNALDYKGQWNHWVFTKDAVAGTMAIYLNGAPWFSGTNLTRAITGITSATLGSQIGGVSSYGGQLDDVRLYNVALTAAAVTNLYASYTLTNGVPVAWLPGYGLLRTDAMALTNSDGDGLLNWQEYVAGLNPLVADSFGITNFVAGPTNTIQWNAVSNRFYNVYWTSNLLQGFTLIGSNVPNGVFYDSEQTNQPTGFYRISVGLAP